MTGATLFIGIGAPECVPVDGFHGYAISRDGIVWSSKRGPYRPLAQKTNNRGYRMVILSRDGIHSTMLIHRLVACAFVLNPDGLREVNHIDGNKLNNEASNLEWCTRSRNTKHSYDIGLREKQREGLSMRNRISCSVPVVARRIDSGETIRFDSMSDAACHGFCRSLISRCVSGLRNSHRGYTWSVGR